jgi:hypothetical protein
MLTLTIPANYIFAGKVFLLDMNLVNANTTAAGGIMNLYVKINGTKAVNIASNALAATGSNRTVYGHGLLTFKTVGAAGTAMAYIQSTVTGFAVMGAATVTPTTVNTTAAVTVTLGWTWTAAVAGTTATPLQAAISELV